MQPTRRTTTPAGEATLKKINTHKAAGLDGVTGRELKTCAKQPTEVFTNIFDLLLQQAIIPTCLQSSNIISSNG